MTVSKRSGAVVGAPYNSDPYQGPWQFSPQQRKWVHDKGWTGEESWVSSGREKWRWRWRGEEGRERDRGAAEPLRTNKGGDTAQLDDGTEPSYGEKIDGEKDRMEKVTVGWAQGGFWSYHGCSVPRLSRGAATLCLGPGLATHFALWCSFPISLAPRAPEGEVGGQMQGLKLAQPRSLEWAVLLLPPHLPLPLASLPRYFFTW